MKISRLFTSPGENVYDCFEYTFRTSVLRNPDGSKVFEMNNIEVPKQWSQVAADILAQKYFRKTGIPLFDEKGAAVTDSAGNPVTGSEHSIRQVVHRMAGCWRDWGEKNRYFDTPDDAAAFYDEVAFMMLRQMAAPNSPQWFNTGLNFAYGTTGPAQGHFYVDPESGEVKESEDAYGRPQAHACFIQSVSDDLVNDGGIFDLAIREARVFKFGSGSGTNYSNLRSGGEKLSGGGSSSGLMSFLKIFDSAAGAIKSGGTTRRAAKMVIVDIDHPDVEKFIEWKAKEEDKVASLVAGSRICSRFLQAIVEEALANGADRKANPQLHRLIQNALSRAVPMSYIVRVLALVEQGYTTLDFEEYTSNYESEAYQTVGGQNSNNTVRMTNEFMKAVENDDVWSLRERTTGKTARVVKARDLWEKILLSSWKCADPGLQFDTTINEWHTCPKSGRINASNPCSEYMFLDDTACNLASLNLIHFIDEASGRMKVKELQHASALWAVVLEISVLMAHFPSREIARLSYEFRTLGLGFANLGTVLMVLGIPYDSPRALALAGAISAVMTGQAYVTSAEMAHDLGAFSGYEANREEMLRVIRNHRRAARNMSEEEYEGLSVKPRGIDSEYCPGELFEAAGKVWDLALEKGMQYGFRNAQVSVIAPTGTIGLVMDCDTTGIEPEFAIVKFKKLAGGGYFKIVNQSVHKALERLGYTPAQIDDIEHYCKGHGTLSGSPSLNRQWLKSRGFPDDKIEIVESQLEAVFDIRFAFNKWILGEDFCAALGFTEEQLNNPDFDMLLALGATEQDAELANDYICGTMTIEGAPHLKLEHLPVFDCASRCGRKGLRYIKHMAHVRMMSAVQPFISGAISKTVNMPGTATTVEIGEVFQAAWLQMVKAITIYRDGSKLSQPLNISSYQDLDEIIMLGTEESLDETKGPREVQERIVERVYHRSERRMLPKRRKGYIREAYVGGHKVFLRTGEYDDGSLGEVFIDMYKEGASFKGLLNCFAVLASKALQYGMPLEELVDSFTFTRFEPAGAVQGHNAIKNSTSILDYVFRSIGYDYLGRKDFVHVKAVDEVLESNGENGHAQVAVPSLAVHAQPEHSATRNSQVYQAKVQGYTGEQCENCGSMRVKQNGTCKVCDDCGMTTGCS
ncbi:vitamin B12-dependent ribonucleotide reductase [Pelodictyon phaeoclathratiforme]|uniref:Vitamin B12-dependent ribonucleotide reductase n=1 Tax=Pelodictyon phaeoclathratiforme (strain DSM 5477 / BU-1) TaxID=324925 RepID=B4SF17_PELPB|nr:vitamin B12-dependent ribonucleotide reductase [Pelodictyon phaeoclathratiforme]ACF43164.1 ribonucleoside-diphosphate reductase, adenosylcobalamin-dependent [Pelodictyon phaeoclathratiforme BU-1]MBV5290604.1 vitamin B12-dependent ribonucleotide reductase [Pelodictyon phaeoclathratiforme]